MDASHPFADLPLFHLRADPDDLAGGLVTHDERRPAAAGRSIPAVDVAAADATRLDAEEHFVGTGHGFGKIGELKVGGGGQQEGFHG